MPITVVKSIKPAGGGDYATLQAWYEDRKGDLVARDTVEVAEVYSGGNVGALLMGFQTYSYVRDSTTDATRHFVIRPAAGQGHGGVYDSSKAFVDAATDNAIWIGIPFTRVEAGLSVRSTANLPEIVGNPHAVLIAEMGAGEFCVVDGVIARVAAGGAVFRAEYCDGGTYQIFKNCVASRENAQSTVGFRATNASMKVLHCFAWAGDHAVDADNDGGGFGHPAQAGIVVTQNCYFAAGVCYAASGAGSSITKGDKDFTSNGEAVDPTRRNLQPADAGLTNPVQDAVDVRLQAGSPLIGAGADLTSEGVVDDFQGSGRVAPFDVGPDQFTFVRSLAASLDPAAAAEAAVAVDRPLAADLAVDVALEAALAEVSRPFFAGYEKETFGRPSFGSIFAEPVG